MEAFCGGLWFPDCFSWVATVLAAVVNIISSHVPFCKAEFEQIDQNTY